MLAILIAALFTYLTNLYEIKSDILVKIMVFLSFLAIIMIIANNFRKNIISSLSHIAFIVIVIGIILATNFSKIKEVNLKVGQSIEIANYKINFNDIKIFPGKNYIVRQGIFFGI